MKISRRSTLELAGWPLFLGLAGCTRDANDHRRAMHVRLLGAESPPSDAETAEFEDGIDSTLLADLLELQTNEDSDIPTKYDQRDDVSISRGAVERNGTERHYLRYDATRFTHTEESAHDALETLPVYDADEDGSRDGIYVRYRDVYVRLRYEVLVSTPS